MIQIQIGRRLIQEQDIRRLRQSHRDPDPLTLPTRELADTSGAERAYSGVTHCTRHGLVILRAPLMCEGLMRIAAARNQVLHQHVARCNRGLREETKAARKGLLIQLIQDLPIQLNDAAAHAEHAGECPQQRRLATCIRADDDRQFALQNIQ